jgi:hypothetical protein
MLPPAMATTRKTMISKAHNCSAVNVRPGWVSRCPSSCAPSPSMSHSPLALSEVAPNREIEVGISCQATSPDPARSARVIARRCSACEAGPPSQPIWRTR